MTQSVTLPASGDNGTTITWASDNVSVIAINGTVSRPTYNDGEDATITVILTATITKNGESDTKTFALTVRKISTSVTLSGITVSKGILQPEFNPSITTYLNAPVPFSDSATPAYNDTQSASITATATNSSSTITINNNTVISGSEYTMSNLAVGANTATIVVTAEDGITTAAYTVTVYRAIPVFKTGAGAISGYSLNSKEDGTTKLGVSWPATRFTDNGNGTMTDNMTGLVWLKTLSNIAHNLSNRITYCEELGTGGSDWRMPNIRELRSLVHYGQSAQDTWLINRGFFQVRSSGYWSSTTSAYETNSAFIVNLGAGGFFVPTKDSSGYVWAVRSESLSLSVTGQSVEYVYGDDGTYQKGVSFPSIRFLDNGDGTITDNMTGLMWLKNANNSAGRKNWSNALTYIAGLNSGTNSGNCSYTDWRLPNVNELETLCNYSQGQLHTWLNGQGFSNVMNSFYWTSTTYAYNTGEAWAVYLGNGGGQLQGANNSKTAPDASSFMIWPVRGPVR